MKFLIALALVFCAAFVQAGPHPGISFPEFVFDPASKIIQGYPAAEGQFPHQVHLRGYVSGGFLQCGASLISTGWAMTAAHCLIGVNTVELRVGSLNVNSPAIIVSTPEFYAHPQYNANNLNNDIGLINMRQNLVVSNTVRPIALPRMSQTSETFAGRVASASGWGFTANSGPVSPTMNFVNLTVVTNADCASVYGTSVVIASTICCRGLETPAQSTCSGDSGGSLMLRDTSDNTDILVGVVSFVSSLGCSSGNPSGFVRPQFFWSWINQVSGIPIRP